MSMRPMTMAMFDNFTKLLPSIVVIINVLLAHPSSSYPDHVQSPKLAPLLQQRSAHATNSYRRFLDYSSSPPTPPSDTLHTPPTDLPTPALLIIAPTEAASPPVAVAPPPPPSTPRPKNQAVYVAVSVSVVVCFAGIFGGWLLYKRHKNLKNATDNETTNSDAPMSKNYTGAPGGSSTSDESDGDPASIDFARKLPKRYPYDILALATSNFNEKNKLGEGGFGPVFKGLLHSGKSEVAVKKVSKRTEGASEQYKAEVRILTRLSHRNLVELLGWSEQDDKFLLVYKFMPNGSLNSQLYNKCRLLTWGERYNIVLGLASALNYLHEECEECILHRDIKPDNVLLDSSYSAKLSDFGLARLVDHDLGVKNTTLAGTMGYMAPEYIQESRASKESDIYSFGVVLLEIACGRAPIARDNHSGVVTNLIDLVWDHYGQKEILKMADNKLNDDYSAEQMERVMIVGLWCAHPVYTERPTIGHAIKVLKLDAPLPELPPSRPPILSLFASLSQIRSSTGNSSSMGLSGSSRSAAVYSQVSSSTSGSAAVT